MTIGVEVSALNMEILGEIRHLKGGRRSYRTARKCSCRKSYSLAHLLHRSPLLAIRNIRQTSTTRVPVPSR